MRDRTSSILVAIICAMALAVFALLYAIQGASLRKNSTQALTIEEITPPPPARKPDPSPPLPEHPTGTLAVDGGTVYWMNQYHKIPFTSREVFLGLGYSFDNVVRANLDAYPLAGNYLLSSPEQAHPWGSWLQKKGESTVYYSHESGLLPAPNWMTFLFCGGRPDLIVPLNEADEIARRAFPNAPVLKPLDPRIVY